MVGVLRFTTVRFSVKRFGFQLYWKNLSPSTISEPAIRACRPSLPSELAVRSAVRTPCRLSLPSAPAASASSRQPPAAVSCVFLIVCFGKHFLIVCFRCGAVRCGLSVLEKRFGAVFQKIPVRSWWDFLNILKKPVLLNTAYLYAGSY